MIVIGPKFHMYLRPISLTDRVDCPSSIINALGILQVDCDLDILWVIMSKIHVRQGAYTMLHRGIIVTSKLGWRFFFLMYFK